MILTTDTGLPLVGNGAPLNTRPFGEIVDTLARPYTTGPMGGLWRGFHQDHPDMFDQVGIVPGGVATIGLTRPGSGGGVYTPNPDNTMGAYDYTDHPGTSAPGIGGAYLETHCESVAVSLTYGGHYAYGTGLHTEATAALHVTPGTDLYALGCWFADLAPGVGVGIIGGVCRPPEAITALDFTLFDIVEGEHPVITCDSDGHGMIVLVDGVQVPFDGVGLNRFPIPDELAGSTLHGFEIDQHIVDYTAGAPSLARMQSAVAFSNFTMTLRG